jgi:hypothetical protein
MCRQSLTHHLRSVSLITCLIAALVGTPAAAQLRAGGIESISPAKGRKGDVVTIQGHGFGSRNVTVTVGGIRAQIVQATGFYVTFRVPDGVKPGLTQVVATNPGFQSGSIQFRILDGILLPGNPGTLLKDVKLALLATGVGSDEILNTILLTRIEVRFRPDATVAQVNNLLLQIDGGIIGIAKGSTFLTIALPKQDSIAAVRALLGAVEGYPGVQFALLAQLHHNDQIFLSTPLDSTEVSRLMRHLLPGRFPAAWNAVPPGVVQNGGIAGANVGLCVSTPVPLLIADDFDASPPSGFTSAVSPFPTPAPPPPNFNPATGDGQHGYAVTLVAAANGFGANPFLSLGCFGLHPVQTAGQDMKMAIDNIVASMPSGKFIINQSQSYESLCQGTIDTQCIPPQDVLTVPYDRAAYGLYWKERTKSRWPDFLMVVAAGNDKGSPGAVIYPGMSDSRFNSPAAVSQIPDTLFNFVVDPGLWDPIPLFASAGFTTLLPTSSVFATLQGVVKADGFDGADSIADNVIVVGSTTAQSPGSVLSQHVTGDQLAESTFSDNNSDVLAVGEQIFFPANFTGTSFAAPQVAALASYLWMLSPDLEAEPASTTKRAIVANSRNHVIDAYATVLSMDEAALPNPANAPMRLNILDVNGDGRFDESDINDFLSHFFVVAPDGTILRQPTAGTVADFSRYDLNGDGFTTAGAKRERFDLDRVGSTQFGHTKYTTVSQNIEGVDIHFDETALTHEGNSRNAEGPQARRFAHRFQVGNGGLGGFERIGLKRLSDQRLAPFASRVLAVPIEGG